MIIITVYYRHTFNSITITMHTSPMTASPRLTVPTFFHMVQHIFSKFPPDPLTPIRSFTWDMMMRMAAADVNPEHTGTDMKLTMTPRPTKLIATCTKPARKHRRVAYAGPLVPIVLLTNRATMAVGPIGTTLLVPNSK